MNTEILVLSRIFSVFCRGLCHFLSYNLTVLLKIHKFGLYLISECVLFSISGKFEELWHSLYMNLQLFLETSLQLVIWFQSSMAF